MSRLKWIVAAPFVTLILVMCSSLAASAAETPTPTQSGANARTSQPPVQPVVGPGAAELLSEMKIALAGVSTYSATVVQSDLFGYRGKLIPPDEKVWKLALERPNLLKCVSIPNGDSQIISDGIHLNQVVSNNFDMYSHLKAPSDFGGFANETNIQLFAVSEIAPLFSTADPLHLLRRNRVKLVSVGAPATINGEPVDVLLMTVEVTDKSWSETDSVALGHDDHLPRRWTESHASRGVSMSFGMTLSNIKINYALADGTFAVAPAPPAFDPKAEALVRQIVEAYAHFHSLSGAVATKTLVLEPESGKVLFMEDATSFKMAQPNLFNATMKQDQDVIRTICDGANLYRSAESRRASFMKSNAPPNFRSLDAALTSRGPGLSFPLKLLDRGDPMGLVSFRRSSGSMRLGLPGELNGTPVDTLILQSKGPSGPAEIATFCFVVGRKDHLIRQYRLSDLVPMIQSVVTFSNLRVNPVLPRTAFQFVPPPGSRARTPSLVPG